MQRKQARETEFDAEAAVDRRTAEDALRFEELAAVVERAVERLPERQRMAFVLHRRHGLSYEEIAQVMQISPRDGGGARGEGAPVSPRGHSGGVRLGQWGRGVEGERRGRGGGMGKNLFWTYGSMPFALS